MNWFRENRWLGTFLIVFGVSVLVALYLLFSAKGAFEEASSRFNDVAAERNRLEHLKPFPNEANFREMQKYLADYETNLTKLKEELKGEALPVRPMAPNEFQTHMREAMTATAEKARANRVALPENFQLGFTEYTAALPDTAAASSLGQELAQIQMLVNILIDSRVDAITAFQRTPLSVEKNAVATPTPVPGRTSRAVVPNGPEMLQRAVVDVTFSASPTAMRRVLNQIASSNQQFFIIRLLHVHSQQEKGPPREQPGASGGTAAESPSPGGPTATGTAAVAPASSKAAPSSAIKFIVGNEHIDVSARIEIVRFTF